MENIPTAIWNNDEPFYEGRIDYATVEREVIIYPDNSFCISGVLYDKDEALVRSLGIPVDRPCSGPYDGSTSTYRLRGGVRLLVFPQPSSENKSSPDTNDVVHRKRVHDSESPIEKFLLELANQPDEEVSEWDEMHEGENDSYLLSSKETPVKPRRMFSAREIKTSLDRFAMDLLGSF